MANNATMAPRRPTMKGFQLAARSPWRVRLQEYFLDYFNNFLTVEKFARYYGFPLQRAHRVIALGRRIHEGQFNGK